MTKKKFSKKISSLLNLKTDLFTKDKQFLKKMLQLNKIYSSGPQRKNCIICSVAIWTRFKRLSIRSSLTKPLATKVIFLFLLDLLDLPGHQQ